MGEEGEARRGGGGGGGGVGFGEVAFGAQFGNAINRQTFFLTGASPRDMRGRPDEVYNEAVAQLVGLAFVGVAERMDASAQLLACTLGVESLGPRGATPARVVPRRNVGAYPPLSEEDPDVLARIEAALAIDLRTHAYALRLLEHRLGALPWMRGERGFEWCG